MEQRLVIVLNEKGDIHLEGNVTSKVIAMGMFEVGKESFNKWFKERAEAAGAVAGNGVVAATAQDLEAVNRSRKM